jgi:hypothetical protein
MHAPMHACTALVYSAWCVGLCVRWRVSVRGEPARMYVCSHVPSVVSFGLDTRGMHRSRLTWPYVHREPICLAAACSPSQHFIHPPTHHPTVTCVRFAQPNCWPPVVRYSHRLCCDTPTGPCAPPRVLWPPRVAAVAARFMRRRKYTVTCAALLSLLLTRDTHHGPLLLQLYLLSRTNICPHHAEARSGTHNWPRNVPPPTRRLLSCTRPAHSPHRPDPDPLHHAVHDVHHPYAPRPSGGRPFLVCMACPMRIMCFSTQPPLFCSLQTSLRARTAAISVFSLGPVRYVCAARVFRARTIRPSIL